MSDAVSMASSRIHRFSVMARSCSMSLQSASEVPNKAVESTVSRAAGGVALIILSVFIESQQELEWLGYFFKSLFSFGCGFSPVKPLSKLFNCARITASENPVINSKPFASCLRST